MQITLCPIFILIIILSFFFIFFWFDTLQRHGSPVHKRKTAFIVIHPLTVSPIQMSLL